MATASRSGSRWWCALALTGALSSLGCQPDRAAAISSASAARPPAGAERQQPSTANGCSCATTVVATHHFQHVVIIVLEKTDVETARTIDYFRQLTAEGASFADFH